MGSYVFVGKVEEMKRMVNFGVRIFFIFGSWGVRFWLFIFDFLVCVFGFFLFCVCVFEVFKIGNKGMNFVIGFREK